MNSVILKRYTEMKRKRVLFRYGLIYTPKRASFDRDHRKRLGLVFAWSYTKEKKLMADVSLNNFITLSSKKETHYRVATVPSM